MADFRKIALFALLMFWFGISAAQEATETAEQADLLLIPFTLEGTLLKGIVPADWDQLAPGSAVRDEETYLVHLRIADTAPEAALPPLLETMNISRLPAENISFEGQEISWQVYHLSYQPQETQSNLLVDLAVTVIGDDTIIIALQTIPAEYERLHSAVFLPAIDLFALPEIEIRSMLGLPAVEILSLQEFGIRSAIPRNWQQVNSGAFMRAASPDDLTTLLIQTSSELSPEAFTALLLEQLNLPVNIPAELEPHTTEWLSWQLFEVHISLQDPDLVLHVAFAEDAQFSYLAALLTHAEESALLRSTILLPVLNGIYALNIEDQ